MSESDLLQALLLAKALYSPWILKKSTLDSRDTYTTLLLTCIVFELASIWDFAFSLASSNDTVSTLTKVQLFCCTLALIASSFLIYCVSTLPHDNEDLSWKEYSASLFSRISYDWLDQIIAIALERALKASDLYELAKVDQAETASERFLKIFKTGQTRGNTKSLLLRSLTKLILPQIIWQCTLSLIDHCLLFAGPYFLHQILNAIADPDSDSWDVLIPVIYMMIASMGRTACESQLYWAIRKTESRLRSALVSALYVKTLRRRVPASNSEEKKQEASSGTGEKEKDGKKKGGKGAAVGAGDGTVTNLMSSDTEKVLACFRQSHYILSFPVLFGLCAVLLVQTVGWAGAVAGIAALSIAVPATRIIGKKIKANRKELIKKSDQRLSRLSEALKGIRTVKLFGWEPFFKSQITDSRSDELKALKSYMNWNVSTQILWKGAPLIAVAATFVARALATGSTTVDAATAFTVLAMFNNVLRYPLFVIPKLAVSLMELGVSLTRLEDYFMEPELERFQDNKLELVFDSGVGIATASGAGDVIGFADDATFGFGSGVSGSGSFKRNKKDEVLPLLNDSDDGTGAGASAATATGVSGVRAIIKDLNFMIPTSNGGLTIVVGPTGCGKTAILMALLGEMRTLNGTILMPGSNIGLDDQSGIAYVAQSPWLQNGTIRENIVFGSAFDSARYETVLDVCALKPDLGELDLGDETVVGERGFALSGGQRQRVSLARAVYSRANILLLDDVLSAVDTHTARYIVTYCLKGPLMKSRTCILVTNAVDIAIGAADTMVVMSHGGRVAGYGPVDDILNDARKNEELARELENAGVRLHINRTLSWVSTDGMSDHASTVNDIELGAGVYLSMTRASIGGKTMSISSAGGAVEKGRTLAMAETMQTGKVEWQVYKSYFQAGGGVGATLLLFGGIVGSYVLGFAHDYALKVWSDSAQEKRTNGTSFGDSFTDDDEAPSD
ncbi:hypothetical protein HDU76_007101, partial [Blyttiomyces sp. JEL0837]